MSDPQNHRSAGVVANDTAVERDGDTPEISQRVSQAEIDDIVNDVHMPIEERIERLKVLTARLETRGNIDDGAEFDPFSAQISEAMNMLAEGGHVYGTSEAPEVEPDSRTGTRAPDDIGDNDML